jgi:hypothetical protein
MGFSNMTFVDCKIKYLANKGINADNLLIPHSESLVRGIVAEKEMKRVSRFIKRPLRLLINGNIQNSVKLRVLRVVNGNYFQMYNSPFSVKYRLSVTSRILEEL